MSSPWMAWLSLVATLIFSHNMLAQSMESATAPHTEYRTIKVDGISIFYREAGLCLLKSPYRLKMLPLRLGAANVTSHV
jgi:hypothetical protein